MEGGLLLSRISSGGSEQPRVGSTLTNLSGMFNRFQ